MGDVLANPRTNFRFDMQNVFPREAMEKFVHDEFAHFVHVAWSDQIEHQIGMSPARNGEEHRREQSLGHAYWRSFD
jgi:hypothetical protein